MRTRPSLVTMLAVAGVLPQLSAGAALVLRLAMVLWLQPDGHAERVAGNGKEQHAEAGREVR